MDVKCLPQLLSTTFLRQGLSQNLELNDWARLAGERAPGNIYILHPVLKTSVSKSSFYTGSGDPNSVPHVCAVGSFLMSHPPGPQVD